MTLSAATRTCLANYATFSGRAPRSEYWWFFLACPVAAFVVGFVEGFVRGTADTITPLLLYLATFLPLLAAGWRRPHDTRRSGWWLLLPFPISLAMLLFRGTMEAAIVIFAVPLLVVHILVLWWLTRPSEPTANRYGPPPREVTP